MQGSAPSCPGRGAGRRDQAHSTLHRGQKQPPLRPAHTPQPLPLRLRRFPRSPFVSPLCHEDSLRPPGSSLCPPRLPAPAPGARVSPCPCPGDAAVPTGPAEPSRAEPCGASWTCWPGLAEPGPHPAAGSRNRSVFGPTRIISPAPCPCTASTPAWSRLRR